MSVAVSSPGSGSICRVVWPSSQAASRRRVASAVLCLVVSVLAALGGLGVSPAAAEVESGTTPVSRFVASQVATGSQHTCAILDAGAVRCWGYNAQGQLGQGSTNSFGDDPGESPATGGLVALPTGAKAVAIAAGGSHTCVVLDGGSVRCWGSNSRGQLGQGSTDNFGDDAGESPATGGQLDLPAGTKAVAVTAGSSDTCVLLDTGRVRCWGRNFNGQLGLGNSSDFGDDAGETPATGGEVVLPAGTKAVTLAAGDRHTCVVLDTGAVRCWGDNSAGQLGLGNTSNFGDEAGETPSTGGEVALPAGTKALTVVAGGGHTCVVLDTGAVRCWGWNDGGQLGLGNTVSFGDNAGETPATGGEVALPAGTKALTVVTGAGHTCVVLDTGALRCWGWNDSGQLGLGHVNNLGDGPGPFGIPETPASIGAVALPAGTKALAVTTGTGHTCAVLDTGALRCWGYNSNGPLGQGNTSNYGDNPGETPATGGAVDLGSGNTIATTPPPVVSPDQPGGPSTPTPPDQPVQPVVGKPGKVRALKVAGRPAAKVRTITWRPPATTGTTATSGPAAIASYRVKITTTVGGKTRVLVTKTIKAPAKATVAIKVKVKRAKLKTGRHTLTVTATNTANKTGTAVTLRFKVTKPRP